MLSPFATKKKEDATTTIPCINQNNVTKEAGLLNIFKNLHLKVQFDRCSMLRFQVEKKSIDFQDRCFAKMKHLYMAIEHLDYVAVLCLTKPTICNLCQHIVSDEVGQFDDEVLGDQLNEIIVAEVRDIDFCLQTYSDADLSAFASMNVPAMQQLLRGVTIEENDLHVAGEIVKHKSMNKLRGIKMSERTGIILRKLNAEVKAISDHSKIVFELLTSPISVLLNYVDQQVDQIRAHSKLLVEITNSLRKKEPEAQAAKLEVRNISK